MLWDSMPEPIDCLKIRSLDRRSFVRAWLVTAAAAGVNAACRKYPLERNFSVERGLHYGPDADQVVDVWLPYIRWGTDTPAAIVWHGGGWVEGVRSDMEEVLCRPLLARGLVVVNAEYRKAPGTRAPAAVQDARAAAAWFYSQARRWRVDASSLIYGGVSAGAHLALMAGIAPESARFGPAPRPLSILNLWGPSDLTALLAHQRAASIVRNWFPPGQTSEDEARMARELSPLTYVRAGLPSVLSIHATGDPIIPFSQSTSLDRALRASSNQSTLVALAQDRHAPKDWTEVAKALKSHLDDTLADRD